MALDFSILLFVVFEEEVEDLVVLLGGLFVFFVEQNLDVRVYLPFLH